MDEAQAEPNDRPVTIRQVAEGEVDLLVRRLARGFPAKHRARFALQSEGKAAYLVAWRAGLPVGHVLIEWGGAREEPMASGSGSCPVISDLFVLEGMRSAGIGSRLLDAAEGLARERGHTRVTLGVATDNPRARALYERRGYADSGLGEYTSRWLETDEGGRERWFEEREVRLVKPLLPPPG